MTGLTHQSAQNSLIAALNWLADQGVDCLLQDEPADRTAMKASIREELQIPLPEKQAPRSQEHAAIGHPVTTGAAFLGAGPARAEALKLAQGASTLEELNKAIQEFDGIAIKKTASNLVFSDGNPQAHIMLVGEAPGADEDRQGKPFVGESGQLLDKILATVGIYRKNDDPTQSIYIANILNWRPPGNRTPSPEEVEVSLPFIERHIQLVAPRYLILCGGVSAKALLGRAEGISRLRKTWHDYTPQTAELRAEKSIPALATYHPSYLLRTPAQKKLVWADMLEMTQKIASDTKNM